MELPQALVFVAACGGIGAFIDFFVGKSGQKNVRARLETWWVRLSDVRLSTFARDEAVFTVGLLRGAFGPTFSGKRIRSLLFVVGVGSLLWLLFGLSHKPGPGELPQSYDAYRFWICAVQLLFLCISLSITIWSVQLVTRFIGSSCVRNFFLYVFLTLLQILLIFITLQVQLGVILMPTGYYDGVPLGLVWDFFLQDLSDEFKNPKIFIYLTQTRLDITNYFFYLGCFLSYFSGFLRLSLGGIFILSILVRPLKFSVLKILIRLVESERPIFTVAFGGVGAIAKLMQSIIS